MLKLHAHGLQTGKWQTLHPQVDSREQARAVRRTVLALGLSFCTGASLWAGVKYAICVYCSSLLPSPPRHRQCLTCTPAPYASNIQGEASGSSSERRVGIYQGSYGQFCNTRPSSNKHPLEAMMGPRILVNTPPRNGRWMMCTPKSSRRLHCPSAMQTSMLPTPADAR